MPTVLEIHGIGDCHICGAPKAGKGRSICSYPHGMIPVEDVGGGMASWKTPEPDMAPDRPHDPGQ